MTLQQAVDNQIFGQVIAETLTSIHREYENKRLSEDSYKRWIKAVGKATVEFENNPFLTWDKESRHLIIWASSNAVYEANGTCQCSAFAKGNPCYHRALARLIQRYMEQVH